MNVMKGEKMLFSSITFIYIFLPVMLLIFYMTPGKAKNLVLLLGSLFFYGFETPKFLPIMLGCIFITYINGILIQKYRNNIHFVISIILCLIPLVYFKYVNFFLENINSVFKTDIKLLKVILPLGISFYTFQMISYLADVKRGKVEGEKSFIRLALYISFFPQLIAGPIVKYTDIRAQIEKKNISAEGFSEGILYFVCGLGKKVLIANQLGELCNLYMPDNSTVLMTWIYMLAYSLQVYFDFSGYSTMAIGIGKMFGFDLPVNFNYPFICSSIRDFWKRWHITLSSFFKEYVYIPLGGSRCGAAKTIRNLFVVWFLTGFWHGADWNFIIWGLYFFVLLILEKHVLKNMNKTVRQVATVLLVAFSFVIFGAADLTELAKTIGNLFTGAYADSRTLFVLRNYLVILVVAVVGSTPLVNTLYEKKIKNSRAAAIAEPVFIVGVILLSTAYLIDGSFNPFLYFRF